MCYLKSPVNGQNYILSNRTIISEEELIKTLTQSNTTYSSPIINENFIGYAMLLGVYSLFFYKLIVTM